MGKAGEYIGIFLVFITVIGIALETAGQFADGEDQAKVKAKVEDFWFFLAGLSKQQIVGETIKLRRRRMKRKYIPLFLILYLLLLFLVISDVLYGNITKSIDDVRATFEQAISTDFTARQLIVYRNIAANINESCAAGYQNCHTDPALLGQLEELKTQEDLYNKLVYDLSQNRPYLLRLAATASAAFSIAVAAIPLTVSLLLSFNFTLFVLSLITKSRMRFVLIVIIDFAVALLFPPLLLTMFLYLGALISVAYTGPLVDFVAFRSANMASLVIATAGITSLLQFTFSATTLLLVYVIISKVSIINGLTLALNLMYHDVYGKTTSFFDDAWRVMHLDFDIDVIESAINWAIFTDILYSFLFLLPALGIVIIQRWHFGRRMFLNLVLWIVGHPKGVIYAFGELLLSFISAVRQLIAGKP